MCQFHFRENATGQIENYGGNGRMKRGAGKINYVINIARARYHVYMYPRRCLQDLAMPLSPYRYTTSLWTAFVLCQMLQNLDNDGSFATQHFFVRSSQAERPGSR